MRLRGVVVAMALACAGAAQAASPQAGLVQRLDNGGVALFFGQPLALNQPVFVQVPTATGRLRCCERLDVSKATQQHNSPMAMGGDPIYIYWMDIQSLPARAKGRSQPYIGMALSATTLAPASLKATGFQHAPLQSLGASGQAFSAYLCWGTEGVNVMTHSAQGWHRLYFGVNYDVLAKPACDAVDERRMLQSGG